MKGLVLQDIVLNEVRRSGAEIEVLLCTGERFCGRIRGFDHATVIFDLPKRQVIAYKQSIAAIFLNEPVLTDEKQDISKKS